MGNEPRLSVLPGGPKGGYSVVRVTRRRRRADTRKVEEIVVRDRVVARLLAVVPAVVVAVAIRVMTQGTPPGALRVVAAGVVALAAWTAYRLLTVKVTIGDAQVHVRGVFYDANISYTELRSVNHDQPGIAVRALLWGAMKARAVRLDAGGRSVRPLAFLSFADDMDIDRAVDAILVRTGAFRIPAQRTPSQTGVPSQR